MFTPLSLRSITSQKRHKGTYGGNGWRERHKTKGLISKTMTLHVRYRFWYISLPSSAKQQREMTKFKVLCRTWTHDCEFSFFYLNCNAVLTDCSASLDRLNELKLSQRSKKYLEVIFKVTFSLALPSWLLKFPIMQRKGAGWMPVTEKLCMKGDYLVAESDMTLKLEGGGCYTCHFKTTHK